MFTTTINLIKLYLCLKHNTIHINRVMTQQQHQWTGPYIWLALILRSRKRCKQSYRESLVLVIIQYYISQHISISYPTEQYIIPHCMISHHIMLYHNVSYHMHHMFHITHQSYRLIHHTISHCTLYPTNHNVLWRKHIMLPYNIIPHRTIYHIILYNIIEYRIILYDITWHHTTQHQPYRIILNI